MASRYSGPAGTIPPSYAGHQRYHSRSDSKLDEVVKPRTKTLRVVCISDTHGMHRMLTKLMPKEADILIHAGDFVQRSRKRKHYEDFNDWLGSLPYKHKIVIGGNHEYLLHLNGEQKMTIPEIEALLSNATYLQDSSVIVEGLNFHGSPWQTSRGMAFSASRKSLERHWRKTIPRGVDVLVTHMPPRGVEKAAESPAMEYHPERFKFMDVAASLSHWGCEALRETVRHRKPRVHIFGHVHEGFGWGTHADCGETLFVNAAQKEYHGRYLRGPIHFDIDVPVSAPRAQIRTHVATVEKGRRSAAGAGAEDSEYHHHRRLHGGTHGTEHAYGHRKSAAASVAS